MNFYLDYLSDIGHGALLAIPWIIGAACLLAFFLVFMASVFDWLDRGTKISVGDWLAGLTAVGTTVFIVIPWLLATGQL